MKRTLRVVLGILNILVCINMLVLFCIFCGWASSVVVIFTWGLPFIATMLLTSMAGIFSLRGKTWYWAVAGPSLVASGLVWIYFLYVATLRAFN